ncbi:MULTISPECIES: hypothetical protein [Stenotrophomonas]|uniref:Toxin CptA n=1 Tax=Stenotrophomonas maltophilia TaxID=40324 RepID=A0A4S2CVL6_STEMA|nr:MULTISPECIES: hypothetical protein [Stenotrophomonas]MBD3825687.1 hypothetical protein [Stenotrophomonas sp.]TGY32998.1 hypothetical protein E5352_13780 [Stenotrophomonas maltophilia]
MPSRPRSSPGSAPCRLEWRPSRRQCRVQVLLAMLVPWALSMSDLPSPHWQWVAGTVVMASLVEAAGQVRRRPRHLLVPPGEAAVMVDGRPVEAFVVRFRGPLVQLRWRQGWRRHALLFWPDTLSAAQRRELRLAVGTRCISRSRRAMAP